MAFADTVFSELDKTFARRKGDRSAASFSKDWNTLRDTLTRLLAVLDIDVTAGEKVIPTMMTWSAEPAHDDVRAVLGQDLTNDYVDSIAAVIRLCAGASLHMTYKPTKINNTTILSMLNQQPAGGQVGLQNGLYLLAHRYLSHGVDLRSSDYVPPYNPAGRAWHNDAAAWRSWDASVTETAAKKVAQKRGMSMDALAYKVRMSPWEWVPYSGGSGKDEGVSIIFDIVQTMQRDAGRGYGDPERVYRGVQAYLDPRGANQYGDRDDDGDDDAGFASRFATELKELVKIREALGVVPPAEIEKRFPTVGMAVVYRKLTERKINV